MKDDSTEDVVRVDSYETSDGKEFNIPRKPRPGRRCQTPKCTGEKLVCPFCHGEHEVLLYHVRSGQKGERSLKSWECERVGKMSLNHGKKFQRYIESITIEPGSKSDQGFVSEGQEKVSREPSKRPVRDSPLGRYVESVCPSVEKISQRISREGWKSQSRMRGRRRVVK